MFKKMNGNMFWVISVLILGLIFMIPGITVAAEPKAGDVIDSNNIDQYKDYFPMFYAALH